MTDRLLQMLRYLGLRTLGLTPIFLHRLGSEMNISHGCESRCELKLTILQHNVCIERCSETSLGSPGGRLSQLMRQAAIFLGS